MQLAGTTCAGANQTHPAELPRNRGPQPGVGQQPSCFPAAERGDLMTTATRPECDTCHKVMTIAQAVILVVAGVTYVLCLDCALSQLEDDDSVSVSVSLLRRMMEGTL